MDLRQLQETLAKESDEHADKYEEAAKVVPQSETEQTLGSLELGAKQVAKGISDAFQYLDPTGTAQSFEKSTGINVKAEAEALKKGAVLGTRSGLAQFAQEVPALAATLVPAEKGLKALAAVAGSSFGKKVGAWAGTGAAENVSYDYLKGELAKEGATSYADIDADKAIDSAVIGASFGGALPLGGAALKGGVKLANNTGSFVGDVIQTQAKKLQADSTAGQSFAESFEKKAANMTSTRKREDLSVAQRVGRTATRILVRNTVSGVAHTAHEVGVLGKEIGSEIGDYVMTKLDKIKKDISGDKPSKYDNMSDSQIEKELADDFIKEKYPNSVQAKEGVDQVKAKTPQEQKLTDQFDLSVLNDLKTKGLNTMDDFKDSIEVLARQGIELVPTQVMKDSGDLAKRHMEKLFNDYKANKDSFNMFIDDGISSIIDRTDLGQMTIREQAKKITISAKEIVDSTVEAGSVAIKTATEKAKETVGSFDFDSTVTSLKKSTDSIIKNISDSVGGVKIPKTIKAKINKMKMLEQKIAKAKIKGTC